MLDPQQTAVLEAVRQAIASVPPLEGVTLTISETGIYKTVTNGETWWRAPVVASPWPDRVYPLYEVLAEIEGILQDDQGLSILLSSSEPKESVLTEASLTP